jgi:hypothetical protein
VAKLTELICQAGRRVTQQADDGAYLRPHRVTTKLATSASQKCRSGTLTVASKPV